MPACKCRFCQANLSTNDAYKIEENKKKAYFCNKEHYNQYAIIEEEKIKKKETERELAKQKREYKQKLIEQEREERKRIEEKKRAEKEVENQEEKEKRKADKDTAYWLICDIIGRKEIINTVLWKEWEIWNKVVTNEILGRYLEENKTYLIEAISKIDNIELYRIKYLSAIIKNHIGDYGRREIQVIEKPIVSSIDEAFYDLAPVRKDKRRSLADLEDEL